MKKNRMMRLASGLLVAVLLTTSVISGTFAKYVTEDSAQDSARVAKWGVAVSVNGNLFGTDYETNAADENKDSIVVTSANVSSAANPQDNIVAPGTKNETGLKIALTGTPEVAYTITADNDTIDAKEIFLAAGQWGVMVPAYGLNADTDFDNNTYYTKDSTNYIKVTNQIGFVADTDYYELIDEATVENNPYYPIKWTVEADNNGNDNGMFTAITENRLDKIQAELIKALTPTVNENEAKVFTANNNAQGSYILTWEWAFTKDNEHPNQNDGADTILGNLMAADPNAVAVIKDGDNYKVPTADKYNLENAFGISVTVTQVD